MQNNVIFQNNVLGFLGYFPFSSCIILKLKEKWEPLHYYIILVNKIYHSPLKSPAEYPIDFIQLPTTHKFNEVGSEAGQAPCFLPLYQTPSVSHCVISSSITRWSISIACEEQLFLQAIDNPKTAASKKSRADITSYWFQLGRGKKNQTKTTKKNPNIRKSYILQSQNYILFHIVYFLNIVIQIKTKFI